MAKAASLIRSDKLLLPDGGIIQIRIWRLPVASIERPHGLKYSLFYGRPGSRIIGYDNEAGKGDHRHHHGLVDAYIFSSLAKLIDDFMRDVIEELEMTELHLRLDSLDGFFRRVRAGARRIDAGDFSARAPSISFASAGHMFATLTQNRWVLLGRLRQLGPSSIRALAKALGRDYRGVHADVSALREVGLIESDADRKVSVPWSRITAEFLLDDAA